MGSDMSNDEEREINQKMAIILSIKVDEMEKKIRVLTNQKENVNIFSILEKDSKNNIRYDDFRTTVVGMLSELRQKIKISEDDIKTIFYILDNEKQGFVTAQDIEGLKNVSGITLKLK